MANFYVTYPSTAISSGPIQFYKNGAPVYVTEDTVTPANSIPLPVTILDGSGNVIAFATNYGAAAAALRTAAQIGNTTGAADFGAGANSAQTLRTSSNVAFSGVTPDLGTGNTGSATQRIVVASDQPALPTKSPVNTNGNYAEFTNLTTTAQLFSPPSNTVGFILESWSSNTQNIRYKIGSIPTVSSGMLMEPGRDTGYIPCSGNVSVIAVAGTNQAISIQWILSA